MNETTLFLNKQSENWASPVIPANVASSMLPHLSVRRLHSQGLIRGINHKNSWYFAERDIAKIVKKEKETVDRINHLLEKQRKKIRIQLYKFIVTLEKCRGNLHSQHCFNVRGLDQVICQAYRLHEKL